MSSTPLGMRPPSFWNFCGSRRNSMISCSSSLASSTPATSLNVTFFCELLDSFALLLPNERALLPPLCIWRMKKIQKPMSSRMGAHEYSRVAHGLVVGSLARTTTPRSISLLARPSYWVGAWVRNESLLFSDARNLVAGDRDAGDLAGLDLGHEGAEADGLVASLESRREVPDEDPHHDEHHPEQQALQGRVHSLPPNGSKLKTTTDFVASVTPNPPATACPATQTIRPSAAVTMGTRCRSARGHLPVDEQVLYLLSARTPRKTHPVARLPGTDDQVGRRRPAGPRTADRAPTGSSRLDRHPAGPRAAFRPRAPPIPRECDRR